MSITITCEECGRRHQLARNVSEPGVIYLVCHNCELPLQAVLEDGVMAAAPRNYAVWDGIFDGIHNATTTTPSAPTTTAG